jgi:hypothetical protein
MTADELKQMDELNVAKLEAGINTVNLPVADALQVISDKGHQFFGVSFRRKNDKKVGGVVVEEAGTIRKMLCRRHVGKYVSGTGTGNRAAQDSHNQVLTVWDVGVYQKLRKTGKTQEQAGKASYRRINIPQIIRISA